MPLKPFILDCDTGRDDALALWCAIALGLPLAGAVASYGNVVMTSVLDNTARVLSLAGWDNIPLFAGASRPMRHHAAYENIVAPRQKKSGNGLCNIHLPRSTRGLPDYAGPDGLAEQIAAISRKKGPLDYIITGPATNFAGICDAMGGRTGDIISRVTMMAGKFDELWDRIPGADFNLVADPYAARFILEQGIKIRFVPMNTTWPVFLNLPDVQSLVPATSLARTAQDIMIAHCRYFAPEPVFRFHDPAALMAVLAPEGFVDAKVDIVLDETREFGRVIETENGFPAQIYRSDEKAQQEFLNRILSALGLSRGTAAAVA